MSPLRELLQNKEIVVCAGAGGVGKTTMAAAIGLHAALQGKKAAVVTIDPARRLASSLGLEELSNEPSRISQEKFESAGLAPSGELYAMMLDTKTTFDEVVLQYAPTRAQAERIIANRFYRNISSTLSGTHEYMAMEKLYELYGTGAYDVIVIDTPPTRDALDFLDAPKRMTDFFESRILQWFLIPTRGGLMRFANAAAATFLRMVKRIVGAEVLEDTAEFFANLEGMYEGFKQRARDVARLLRSNVTSFVVVTSPMEDAVKDATYFASKLDEAGFPFGALIVNRVHPRYGDGIDLRPRQLRRLEQGGPDARLLAKLLRNEVGFMRLVRREESNLQGLARKIPHWQWAVVPYLEQEAVDLPGLVAISEQLYPREEVAHREPDRFLQST